MALDRYIACLCEGAAEEAIMELLLEHDKLKFTAEDLIEERPLRCRKASAFESRYLRMSFDKPIVVYRIIDSRPENFRLSAAYREKVESIINVVTAPEIEMLIVINEGKYNDFQKVKSKKKPSVYCKEMLGNVKARDFIMTYFKSVDTLIHAIKDYQRMSRPREGEWMLADLLKE